MFSGTLFPPQVPEPNESVKSRPFAKSPPLPIQWAWFTKTRQTFADSANCLICRSSDVWMPTEWPSP